ncbi:MAG: hypothetical protein Tsb009_24370 [Planctomycetaceae bacterium]
MIDVLFIAILATTTLIVSRKGAFHAATWLMTTVFSGLLAMNFFEPVAELLEDFFEHESFPASLVDIVSLVGLFVLFVCVARFFINKLAPAEVELEGLLDAAGRWLLGFATGYVLMAFVAVALQTGPFPRDFWGHFPPEPENRTGPFGAIAPDHQWLGFTQAVSAGVFRQRDAGRIFDAANYRVGNQDNVWSSFPIRYATRREERERRRASN